MISWDLEEFVFLKSYIFSNSCTYEGGNAGAERSARKVLAFTSVPTLASAPRSSNGLRSTG